MCSISNSLLIFAVASIAFSDPTRSESSNSSLLSPATDESPDKLRSGRPRPSVKQISVLDGFLNELVYMNVLTSSIYNYLGGVECTGVDGTFGVPIASTIIGLMTGDSVDFGGSSLCNISCAGTCVPYPAEKPVVAPASLYPFGCNCAETGCNADGPIPPPRFIPNTMISCDKSTDCTCGNLPNAANSYTGYICNWWNLANGDYIYVPYNAAFSPIRWCNCYPNVLEPITPARKL